MHFSRSNVPLRSSKRCQKNGAGELFAFAGSNNDICIISGLNIEKQVQKQAHKQLNQLLTEQKNDLIFSYLRFRSYLSSGFIVHFVWVKGGWKHQVCPFLGILGLFGSKNGPQKWPKIANQLVTERKNGSFFHISNFAHICRSTFSHVLFG